MRVACWCRVRVTTPEFIVDAFGLSGDVGESLQERQAVLHSR
jgi:hypothetical protein